MVYSNGVLDCSNCDSWNISADNTEEAMLFCTKKHVPTTNAIRKEKKKTVVLVFLLIIYKTPELPFYTFIEKRCKDSHLFRMRTPIPQCFKFAYFIVFVGEYIIKHEKAIIVR